MSYQICPSSGLDLQVVTVATEETDGFKRFMNSAKYYDIPVEVIIGSMSTFLFAILYVTMFRYQTEFCNWFLKSQTQVVGMGQKWQGGDIQRYPGGGFKINLLKPVVEQWKDREDLLVMFVDRLVILSEII